jgi:hypothetical protein
MIRQTRRMTPKRNSDSLGSTRGSRLRFGGSPKHSFLTERNKENEDCSAHELPAFAKATAGRRERTRKLDRQNTSLNPKSRSPSENSASFGVFSG